MLGKEKMGRRVARRDKHSQGDCQTCEPASRSRDAATSIDASYKLSIDAGRKQDLTAPSMTVDVCGSERWARSFRVMRSIEDSACSTVSNVVNRLFVLTSCFHAEPSNLHVRQMPGFLRTMLLACIAVQPCSTDRPAGTRELGLQYFPVLR